MHSSDVFDSVVLAARFKGNSASWYKTLEA